ncbi:MAG: hypothetical protein ABL927_09995, partial [Bdellovibrionales bacterium]
IYAITQQNFSYAQAAQKTADRDVSGVASDDFAGDEKSSTAAIVTKDLSVPAIRKQKSYPGGRDEEDIRVQESLRAPTVVVDRNMIQKKVLKNYFKKTIEEAPTLGMDGSSDHEELPPENAAQSETESQ